jgi:FkbM family methyltransferase
METGMLPPGLARFINQLNPTSHGKKWLTSQVNPQHLPPAGIYSVGHGIQLELEPADITELAIYFHAFELMEIRSFLGWLKPGMHVVDIGANIGLYSCLAHSAIGSSGKIWSFEPNPIIFARLKKNLALNRVDEAQLFNCALGNVESEVTLYSPSGQTHGLSSLQNQGWQNTVQVKVPCHRLDNVINQDRIDVIKIDVEGAEKLVLEGAVNIIRTHKPKLIIEFNPTGTAEFGYTTLELAELILSFNPTYKISRIDAHCVTPTDFKSMKSAGMPGGNFIFEPAE